MANAYGRLQTSAFIQHLGTTSIPITYTTVIATCPSDITEIVAYNPAAVGILLSVGSAGNEVVQVYLPPGLSRMNVLLPKGTRVAVASSTGTLSSGDFIINFFI